MYFGFVSCHDHFFFIGEKKVLIYYCKVIRRIHIVFCFVLCLYISMSCLHVVDRVLLDIGRSVIHLSGEQIYHHEVMLRKFIAAEDEEDDPYITGDDDGVDYVPIDDGGV